MAISSITPGRPGIGGGAPIFPVYPPTVIPPALTISVAEAIVVEESFASLLSLRINLSDAVTITDSPTLFRTPLQLSASESITIAEATALLIITPGTVNLLDLTSVTDAAIVFITTLFVSPSDSTTVSESVSLVRISPVALPQTQIIPVTDLPSIFLLPVVPDIPPIPPITTDPGSILCICQKAGIVTEIDMFPFAATIIPRCNISEAEVLVEIVLPNLGANCAGPVFQNPMPPVSGAPGAYQVRVEEPIIVDSTPTLVTAIAHGCPCVPSEYVVDSSISDDFNSANGPDFPAGWTSVTFDPLFAAGGILGPNNSWPSIATIRILNGDLENHRPKNEVDRVDDGSISVNGFRNDIGPAPNWLVRAVWGSDAKTSDSSPNKWYLMAPMSFNAGPPYNALMMSCFAFYAQHLSDGTHPEDGYYFSLVQISAGGIQSNIGSRVHKTVAEWGPGHSFALKVVCNELSCITIQGLVDDIVEVEATSSTISSKPTGYAGAGLANDYLPNTATFATNYQDNYASLASWTADILI